MDKIFDIRYRVWPFPEGVSSKVDGTEWANLQRLIRLARRRHLAPFDIRGICTLLVLTASSTIYSRPGCLWFAGHRMDTAGAQDFMGCDFAEAVHFQAYFQRRL